jgi:NitT/TauT family transport system substrate-binding protein
MKRKVSLILISLLLVIFSVACSSQENATSGKLDKVTLLLDWSWWPPQIPLIVAQEKGFYKEFGIELEILQGQGSGSTAIAVGEGKYNFGHINHIVTAQSISKGVPITSIATVAQKGASGIVFLKDAGIKEPKDMKGKKLGSTPGGSDSHAFPAFLAANGMDKSDIELVNLPGDAKLGALLSGQINALSGDDYYYISLAKREGKTLESLRYSDYGANHIGYGLIANNDYLKQNPDIAKRFLQASLKGYEYAFNNIDESIEIYKKVSGLDQSEDFVRENLLGYQSLFESENTEGKPFGWNSEKNWRDTVDMLVKYGGITKKPIKEYFTNELFE